MNISGDWRAQIHQMINRANVNLQRLSFRKWDFIVSLLDDYNEAAAEAMGSLKADRGGYPTIEFRKTKVYHKEWEKLSVWTVAVKNGMTEDPGDGMRGDILAGYWNRYASTTPIWDNTGEARKSLKTNWKRGTAGIFEGPTLEYAKLVEYGGESNFDTNYGRSHNFKNRIGTTSATVPARPLFEALNIAFENYIRSQLSNKKSQLYKEIVKEVKAKGLWE